MSILKAPLSKSKDFFDQGKFNLTWYTFVVYFFLAVILTVIHINGTFENLIITSVGIIVSLICLFILYQTRKHQAVAIISVIASTIAIQFAIYTLLNPDRTVDLIWIFVYGIYAFYALNIYWGVGVLVFNFIGLGLYQLILGDSYTFSKPLYSYSNSDQVDYYINLTFGVIFISYLVIRLIKDNQYATEKFSKANKELIVKNHIVIEQNEEKTIMLKEIHHRVKNNLQIVTSLLRLQSRDLEDKKTLAQFDEATNRIFAMSLIHDKMYQSEDLAKIDFKDYLESLISDLINSYSITKPVSISIKSSIQLISPKFLVSIALLFNELVTNSLKHGFENQKKCSIKIEIKIENKLIILSYLDNGTWKPQSKQNSFGTELIETLCEQLDGDFTRSNENGTLYIFKFPYIEDKT